MDNPWEAIRLEIYERHMGAPAVGQLQALATITGEQLADYPCRTVAILGAAGGNGLEHIDPARTDTIYAIDIHPGFLETCRARYGCLGDRLKTLCLDLTAPGVTLPSAELFIANLVIEYIGVERFVAALAGNRERVGIASCVIQRNHDVGFVSPSPDAGHFRELETVHHEIDAGELRAVFLAADFCCIHESVHPLAGGKELVRLDFQSAGRGSRD